MFNKTTKVFLGIVIVLFVVVMSLFYVEIERTRTIKIYPFDLASLPDGQYTGQAKTLLIEVEVLVNVEDHQISSLELMKYQHNRGDEAVLILDEIVAQNSITVDNISGATTSSVVIKAAVSDALRVK